MRILKIHLLSRLRSFWMMMLIMLFAMFFLYCIKLNTRTAMENNIYQYMIDEPFPLVRFLPLFTALILTIIMGKSYAWGKARWMLLCKDKRMYIMSDILFFALFLILGAIMHLLCARYGYWFKLQHLEKTKQFINVVPSFLSVVKANENFGQLFSIEPLQILNNVLTVFALSSYLTYITNYVSIIKKQTKEIVIFLGILTFFVIFRSTQFHDVLHSVITSIFTMICILLSVQIWSVKNTGGKYVKH